MLKIVTDHPTLAEAHRRIVRVFTPRREQRTTFVWLDDPGIWLWARTAQNRYWHAFGLSKPIHGKRNIVVEINFPLSGTRNTLGGGVARDETGELVLVHFCKCGGRRQVSPADYKRFYPMDARVCAGGSEPRDAVELGRIDDGLPTAIKDFAKKIQDVKSLGASDYDAASDAALDFNSDPKTRKAVEEYAVRRAKAYFSKRGFKLRAEPGKPFDLEYQTPAGVLRIEVKGRQGPADCVIITRNELEMARKGSVLFVVDEISVANTGGTPRASGGREQVFENWPGSEGLLEPITYRYTLPKSRATGAS